MVQDSPDLHGPYEKYYKSWFKKVEKGIDYTNKKVCFKEIYFPPVPGVPWFWNDWVFSFLIVFYLFFYLFFFSIFIYF
jgi:hypothetical protein